MGLSARKEKQKIGDDPRNTKWARNESNPGFKLLSSMGWTPTTKTLGLTGDLSDTLTTWKKHPTTSLPVIKSDTSGLGANPNIASSSYNGIGGSPCFVKGKLNENRNVILNPDLIENEVDRQEKLSIVSNGGGFNDLLNRLNQDQSITQNTGIDKEEGFVLINLPNHISETESNHEPISHVKRQKRLKKKKRKHQELKETDDIKIFKEGEKDSIHDNLSNFQSSSIDSELNQKPRKRVRIVEDHIIVPIIEEKKSRKNKSSKKLEKKSKSKVPTSELINDEVQVKNDEDDVGTVPHLVISRPINPRMAARAKYIKSKKLATSMNPTAMAEILGIPST